jgi:hypothetical protein
MRFSTLVIAVVLIPVFLVVQTTSAMPVRSVPMFYIIDSQTLGFDVLERSQWSWTVEVLPDAWRIKPTCGNGKAGQFEYDSFSVPTRPAAFK